MAVLKIRGADGKVREIASLQGSWDNSNARANFIAYDGEGQYISAKNVDEALKATSNKLGEVDSQLKKVTDTDNAQNASIGGLSEEIATERARINNFVKLQEGSTTGDAELADIRVGYDGTVYENAGESVRNQSGVLAERLSKTVRQYNLEPLAVETKGKRVDSDGGISTVDGYSLKTLPIEGGKEYQIAVTNADAVVWFYDAYGNPLDSYYNLRVYGKYGFTAIVPENATTLKWRVDNGFANPYICLAEDVSKVKSGEYGEVSVNVPISAINDAIPVDSATDFLDKYGVYNRINPSTITNGYYWGNTGGAIGTNDNYRITDYIPVTFGETLLLLDKDMQPQPMRFVKAFDKDKNQLQDGHGAGGGDTFYTVQEGEAFVRITLYNEGYYSANGIMLVSENPGEFLPYGDNRISYSKVTGVSVIKTVDAYIPDDLYCAVGRTIELYNRQVCLQDKQFHIRWNCQVGKALRRKFSVTGTAENIGDHSLTLEVYDNNMSCLYSKTATLHIVKAGVTNNYRICPIGDSLTNGKYWLPEVVNLSDEKIMFVGTYSADREDAEGNVRTISHEGRSGFAAEDYIKGNPYTYEGAPETVHNRFWNSSKSRFDWAYYKSTNNINPDCVQIYLGSNHLGYDNTTNVGYIKQIVDYIRQDDASIPIFVVNPINRATQDGLGANVSADGFAGLSGMWEYSEQKKIMDLMMKLDETFKDYANLHMVNLALTHDDEHNFGAVQTPVNPRAAQTELMPDDGIHPDAQGYYQMADVMYSVYCAFLN